MKIFIYALIDPVTEEIRYVGKTHNLKARYGKHFNSCNNTKTRNANWIKSLLKRGIKPIMEVIHECDESNWSFWEQHYISLYKSWNLRLNNHTAGGEGSYGYKHRPEIILKLKSIKKLHHSIPENNPMFGKHHSKDSTKIMAVRKIGIFDGGKNPRAKAIEQYDVDMNLIEVWSCAKLCADKYNLSRGNISSAASHNTPLEDYNRDLIYNINASIGTVVSASDLTDLINKLCEERDKLKKYKILGGFIFKYKK